MLTGAPHFFPCDPTVKLDLLTSSQEGCPQEETSTCDRNHKVFYVLAQLSKISFTTFYWAKAEVTGLAQIQEEKTTKGHQRCEALFVCGHL